VGSNSTASVKSTPAPVVIIEEPDDANVNVKGQGDSIKLLEERAKTFHRRKIAMGGTPSISGLSTIEDAYNNSDKRRFFVPCHDCGESHALDWDHVRWREDQTQRHEIYAHALTETACYACPHCGAEWDDSQKNRNVRSGEWRATAEFRGVAGFHINELYSPFPGSVLAHLVERWLEAKKKADEGDDTDLIVFTNSALGKAYEYQSDAPDADDLQTRVEDYPELVVPHGGLLLTAGVDVQHDRFAIVIRVWGRGEELWLVYWGEIYGAVPDRSDPVWDELDKRLFTPVPHAGGGELHVGAISIDSGDGKTNDAVYDWVRKHRRRGVMAIKGASEGADKEIFSTPRSSIDHKSPTKAARYGLRVYIVGTDKAKDLIAGRVQLDGQGPGRFHYYREVRADYFEQMTSEVKAPSRRYRGRRMWQLRAGQRNEALDAEVYALHAARAKKPHTMGPTQWDALEASLKQGDLLSEAQEPVAQDRPPPVPRRRDAGLGSEDWAL
jgi:phage terminase large subunit GpA-like protein